MLVQKISEQSDKPSSEDLALKKEFYSNLFLKDKLKKETLEINYEGDDVDDSIPEEAEIIEALFKLRNRKAPGLTGISVEQMKLWYELSLSEDEKISINKEAERNWNIIVRIIQTCFKEGNFLDVFQYRVLVLIPKDDVGGVRGIGLLETLHKLASSNINIRLTKRIKFVKQFMVLGKKEDATLL